MLYALRQLHILVQLWKSGTSLLITDGLKFEVRAVILTISADCQTNSYSSRVPPAVTRNKRGACRLQCKIGNFLVPTYSTDYAITY